MPGKRSVFIDRCLARKTVPAALRIASETVVVHDEHFPDDTEDEVWLAEAGRRGWIAITKDVARANKYLQRLAVAMSGARLFVLRSTEPLSGSDQASVIVRATPRMHLLAEQQEPPFIARVYKSGDVKLWRSRKQLMEELDHYNSTSQKMR